MRNVKVTESNRIQARTSIPSGRIQNRHYFDKILEQKSKDETRIPHKPKFYTNFSCNQTEDVRKMLVSIY